MNSIGSAVVLEDRSRGVEVVAKATRRRRRERGCDRSIRIVVVDMASLMDTCVNPVQDFFRDLHIEGNGVLVRQVHLDRDLGGGSNSFKWGAPLLRDFVIGANRVTCPEPLWFFSRDPLEKQASV